MSCRKLARPARFGGGDGARTHEPLDCQSSALPTELRPRGEWSPYHLPWSARCEITSDLVFLGAARVDCNHFATEGPSGPLAENDPGHLVSSGLVDLAADVAVDVADDSDRAVAETFLHHLQPYTGLQGGAGVGRKSCSRITGSPAAAASH
jgi:hypothetical protein